ncbi:MAG: c-type cytochrome [Candidatus Nitrospinota bacterium M3_3B_026]
MTEKDSIVSPLGAALAAAVIFLTTQGHALAASGSVERGKELYLKYCYQCHGFEGRGDGPASIYQARKPRDFTDGLYKLKTSEPEYIAVRDEDLFNAITNGMSASGMPRWENILTERQRWDLVAYVKSLSEVFEEEPDPPPLDLGGRVPYTEESVERGKWAYLEFKCDECHGPEGRGRAIKLLKDDYGYRIWPRDLTKPWTYIGSSEPEGVYARVTNGIPLTPMPSFYKQGQEDVYKRKRWDVVNYVRWMTEEAEKKRRRWRIEMGIFAGLAAVLLLIYARPVISRYLGGGK